MTFKKKKNLCTGVAIAGLQMDTPLVQDAVHFVPKYYDKQFHLNHTPKWLSHYNY